MERLADSVINEIVSNQIITSLRSCVKELVENSLDAGASTIQVRLRENGSELVEVVDNGRGVAPEDFVQLTKRHSTSKVRAYEDISESLSTFGFRGEALSAMCAMGDVTVLSRVAHTSAGMALRYDLAGQLVKQEPAAREVGTTVSVRELFRRMPVRHREFLRGAKAQILATLRFLQACAIAHPSVRFHFVAERARGTGHARTTLLSTAGAARTLHEAAAAVLTDSVALSMEELSFESDRSGWSVSGLISSTADGGRRSRDMQFFYINQRPVEPPKSFTKCVNEAYRERHPSLWPVVILFFTAGPTLVDVNVTPDKSTVLVRNEEILVADLQANLTQLYTRLSSGCVQGALSGWIRDNPPPCPDDFVGSQSASTGSYSGVHDATSQGPMRGVTGAQIDEAVPTLHPSNSQSTLASWLAYTAPDAVASKVASLFAEAAESSQSASTCTSAGPNCEGTTAASVVLGSITPCNAKKAAPAEAMMGSAIRATEPETLGPHEPAIRSGGFCDPTIVKALAPEVSDNTRPCGAGDDRGVLPPSQDDGHESDDGVVIVACSRAEENTASQCSTAWTFPLVRSQERNASGDMLGAAMGKLPRSMVATGSSARAAQQDAEGVDPSSQAMEELSPKPAGSKSMPQHGVSASEGTLNLPLLVRPAEDAVTAGGGSTMHEAPWSPCLISRPDNEYARSDVTPPCFPNQRDANKPSDAGGLFAKTDDELDAWTSTDADVPANAVDGTPAALLPAASVPESKVVRVSVTMADLGMAIARRRSLRLGGKKECIGEDVASDGDAYFPSELCIAGLRSDATPRDQVAGPRAPRQESNIPAPTPGFFQKLRVVGQFNLGFILAVTPPRKCGQSPDIFIADQHACDEVRRYEELSRVSRIEGRPLIPPHQLCLTPAAEHAALRRSEAFRLNGMSLDVDANRPAGERLLVTSVPTGRIGQSFGDKDIVEFVQDVVSQPSAFGDGLEGDMPRPQKVRRLFMLQSCREAVYVDKPLRVRDMELLLSGLDSVQSPWFCPHKRPTVRHLTDAGLARRTPPRDGPLAPCLNSGPDAPPTSH